MAKKLVDPDKLCLGCMQVIDDISKPCPYCGFLRARYQMPPNSIPLCEILKGKYLMGRVIGVGGFGMTYVGWDLYQSKRVCIKEYFPRGVAQRDTSVSISTQYSYNTYSSMSVMMTKNDERIRHAYVKGLEAYIQEAEILSKFYMMPGIVSVRDFFYGNATAYIVMEYIEGTDLRKLAKANGKKLPPEILLPMLQDVIKALDAVHKVGIIHRDISPDNIMVTPSLQAKVIDFGAAKNQGTIENSILLKHGYAPIEQYDRNGNQGPWTDVYSICASIYHLLTGLKLQKAYDRIADDQVVSLRTLGVPVTEAEDQTILKGLSVQTLERFQTMEEFYQSLYGKPIVDIKEDTSKPKEKKALSDTGRTTSGGYQPPSTPQAVTDAAMAYVQQKLGRD